MIVLHKHITTIYMYWSPTEHKPNQISGTNNFLWNRTHRDTPKQLFIPYTFRSMFIISPRPVPNQTNKTNRRMKMLDFINYKLLIETTTPPLQIYRCPPNHFSHTRLSWKSLFAFLFEKINRRTKVCSIKCFTSAQNPVCVCLTRILTNFPDVSL